MGFRSCRSRLFGFILVACGALVLVRFYLVDTPASPTLLYSSANGSAQHEEPLFVPSSYSWGEHQQAFPVAPENMTRPPVGRPRRLGRVQHRFGPRFLTGQAPGAQVEARRDAVRDAFVRCWHAYEKHAWRQDELRPVTLDGKDPFGGWAATLLDSLDTLLIMDLQDEFERAVPAVAALDWGRTDATSLIVFETTIRHLGGLLSAYDLSKVDVLLMKAVELGDMLYVAFDTPNRMPSFTAFLPGYHMLIFGTARFPLQNLDFEQARAGHLLAGTNDPSAAQTSLGLEFTRLSQLTGDPKYFDAIDRVKRFLARTQSSSKLPGMWPVTIDFQLENLGSSNQFSLGALADSLYEYLPKMAALLGGLDADYERMYRHAADTAEKHLLFRPMLPPASSPSSSETQPNLSSPSPSPEKAAQVKAALNERETGRGQPDILFSGRASTPHKASGAVELDADIEHLACFGGGMFGLGGKLFGIKHHMDVGERLAKGCAWAYNAFPTGIMPEIMGLVRCKSVDGQCPWDEAAWKERTGGTSPELPEQMKNKGIVHVRDPRYLLRPEAVESLFLMYRMTGNAEYQDLAWTMFQAVQRATQTPLANSAIQDVTKAPDEVEMLDSMESFWLGETLKYFYLIFSPPDLISLDDYVFNTEAHPLRRPK